MDQIPLRDAAQRRAYLADVAEKHDAWQVAHLEDAPFDPESRPDSGDYNVWHLDMDADAATQDEFMNATAPPVAPTTEPSDTAAPTD